jgi:hypothetical protein
MMIRKEHLTVEGQQQIVNLRASLNWGLTPTLNNSFPKTVPVDRPEFLAFKTIDPN